MDSQKRIVIPQEFRESNFQEERINIYYSVEEKLFFGLFGEIDSNEFFVGSRGISKGRIFLPSAVIDCYGNPNDVIIAMKNGRMYFLPI